MKGFFRNHFLHDVEDIFQCLRRYGKGNIHTEVLVGLQVLVGLHVLVGLWSEHVASHGDTFRQSHDVRAIPYEAAMLAVPVLPAYFVL